MINLISHIDVSCYDIKMYIRTYSSMNIHEYTVLIIHSCKLCDRVLIEKPKEFLGRLVAAIT